MISSNGLQQLTPEKYITIPSTAQNTPASDKNMLMKTAPTAQVYDHECQ